MTQEMLWFVHVFDDYVERYKLAKNFCPDDLLTCCHDLSETEREWLENWIRVWNILGKQEKNNES